MVENLKTCGVIQKLVSSHEMFMQIVVNRIKHGTALHWDA